MFLRKWKALKYYYTKTSKGRFELSHYKTFLVLVLGSSFIIDVVLYFVWLRKI